VFPHSFWPNAAIFFVGCFAAVYLLRTGIVVWGTLALASVALCADLALVARFGFDGKGPWFAIGLYGMQAVALYAAGWIVVARSRRRWSQDGKQKAKLVEAAMRSYVAGDLGTAGSLYRRIRKADPWDLAARIGLGNVARRLGRVAEARRHLGAARRLDCAKAFGDLLDDHSKRLME
jgi:hypothetical protein